MEWTAGYVGAGWRRLGRVLVTGVDCWGLSRLPVIEVRGQPLPMWDTVETEDGEALDGAVEAGRNDGSWLTVPESETREFDFVRMRAPIEVNGRTLWRPVHIGLVAPRRHVLHIQRDETSQLVPIDAVRRRITEFCRHRGLQ